MSSAALTYEVGPDLIQHCLNVVLCQLQPRVLVHDLLNFQNLLQSSKPPVRQCLATHTLYCMLDTQASRVRLLIKLGDVAP